MDLEAAEERLNSEDNLLNMLNIRHTRNLNGAGRKAEVANIPQEIKELVAITAEVDGVKVAAEAFGVSKVTTSHLKHGRDYKGKENEGVKGKLEGLRKEVETRAIDKVLAALNLVDENKLAELGPDKVARVANDLASVSEKMREKVEAGKNVAQVIIYAPQVRSESEYKTITIER